MQTQEIMDDIQDEDGSSALPGFFSLMIWVGDDFDSDSEMPYKEL